MTDNASQPRIRWLLALLALAAALFLVVASACGGDDDDDDGGDDGGATATESADGGDDGDEATPTEEADDGGDGGGDAAEKLSELAGDYEKFEGYVKYGASNFSGDSLTSMAIYQKGDKSRVDIDSSEGLVIIIETPDGSYVCSENQCLQYPSGETGGVGDLFTAFIDPSTIEDQFGDIDVDYDVSEEEIAGIDATCFSANGDLDPDTAGDESGEVCFAEGGLLLRITFEGGGESGTLEATEAETNIGDDVFDPPYEVIDISDIGQ